MLGDICGNDVSFNNVDLLGNTITKGDISGNDASFNNMDIRAIESTNWYIKANGDMSGNDASFNNMDIRAIESTNWHIKVNGNISGNDVIFNNIEVTKDISGNTSKFVSIEVDKVTSNNWTIKTNGDISGNDASFNNMDIRAIESANWNIKVNGDISGNDVSFNSIYVTNDISANNWDIKQNGDISGNDVSFNDMYITGNSTFDGDISANDASFNFVGISQLQGLNTPVFGEFDSTWTTFHNRIDGVNSSDYFASAIAFNALGDVVVTGTKEEDIKGSGTGMVKVYKYDPGQQSWVQWGSTIFGYENNYERWGYSVDINNVGDRIIVGGRQSNIKYSSGGLVRVFEMGKNYNNETDWVQVGIDSDIEPVTSNDYLGSSVSMNSMGNIIAVGAYGQDTYHTNGGVVRVYYLNSSNRWILQGTLQSTSSNEQFGGGDGESLSLNGEGTVLAAGAWQNSAITTSAGNVRIYKYDTSWTLAYTLTTNNSYEYMGYSVSLNTKGNVLIIGSPGYSQLNYKGRVRVYRDDGTNWVLMKTWDGPRNSSYFGNSVDINSDGNIIAIGAYGDIDDTYDIGAVYVFKWNNGLDFSSGDFTFLGGNKINGGGNYRQLGEAVALNNAGTRLAANYRNYNSSYAGSLQVWKIADLSYETNYITISDDISGNDASFNNINLLGDICGNDASFNNIEILNSLKLPVVSSAPSDTPSVGTMKFNTGDNKLYIYTGSTDGWKSYSPD